MYDLLQVVRRAIFNISSSKMGRFSSRSKKAFAVQDLDSIDTCKYGFSIFIYDH